ncbi:MAG: TolC family protein, partial [Duodenibacillus sp.]|nr:TolC family protein [Duodenibacillus sp.]
MRLTPCIALAAAAFACGAPAETINRAPLDFGQARLCAHQQAAMLKVHAAETARREHDTEASRSLHGPKVTLDVRYLEGRKTVSLGKMKIDALGGTKTGNPMIDGMLASIPPVNLDLGMGMKLDGPRAVVGMELPIYTGGAISAKVAAGEASVHESRAQEQAERNQIDVKLAQKYFGVQLAESIVRLRRETLAQQEKEVKRARKFEKAGMISRIERMSVEVSRDAAKRELLSSKTDLKVARAEL